jgi:mannitol/fructose-specific phosphotransferase system IIA component (Ntr-type)
MKNLLNALQEGRFVELPETNKEKALVYLANLIEAAPDMRPGTDVAGAVLAREAQFNTAIGMGWACPHMRTSLEGDIICAAGWSPLGIDYAAPDGKPVYIVVMYYVPDSQKNVYLKEISSLVKVIQRKQAEQDISKFPNLAEARHWILDLVSTALESQMSDAKARMIHLEARQAAVPTVPEPAAISLPSFANSLLPLSIFVSPTGKPVILAQDADLVARLESAGDIDALALSRQAPFDFGGYKLLVRSVANYQSKRQIYDCLALKLIAAPVEKPKV